MTLYDTLLAHRDGSKYAKNGNVPITCPFCGKTNADGYHAGIFHGRRGYVFKCLVCQKFATLDKLAAQLGIKADGDETAVAVPIVAERLPAPWLPFADKFQREFLRHPRRVETVQAYKPMPAHIIERYGIGVGRMPRFTGKNDRDPNQWLSFKLWGRMATRITIPLITNGAIVGFSGRALTKFGPKWVNATGSDRIIWGMDWIDGRPVVVCENQFDAAWASGLDPNRAYIATNGTAVAQKTVFETVQELKTRGVPRLTLLFDNDLAGQARGEARERMRREWYIEHAEALKKNPHLRPPESCAKGWQTACEVNRLPFTEWAWGDAPDKADLGYLIERRNNETKETI